MNANTALDCENCAGKMSLLENEAFAAVREIVPFVKSIYISEVLSRYF